MVPGHRRNFSMTRLDNADARDRSVFVAQLPMTGSVVIILIALAIARPASLAAPAIVAAMLVVFIVTGFAIVVPWHRLPRFWVGLLPLIDLGAIGLMHLPDSDVWLTVLVFLPAVWLATEFEYLGAIIATLVGGGIAMLTVVGSEFDERGFVRAVLLPICLVFVSVTVAARTKRTRSQQGLLRQQGELLEEALGRAQRDRRVLNSILDTIDFGIIGINAANELRLINRSVSRLLGLDPRERARPVDLLASDNATPVALDEHPLTRAANGETFHDQVYWRHPHDAPPIALAVSANQNFSENGDSTGAVVVFSDVTVEVDALKARDRLVSAVSHELRTPLTAVIGYLDLVLEDDAIDDASRKHLEAAARNAERMQRLTADLLTASRTREGLSIHIAQVDVAEIVVTAVDSARAKADARGTVLENHLPEHIEVLADGFRLRQVIDNVISNAIKYGRDNGHVRIHARDTDEELLITIADDGIGIAADDLEHLFDRFYRSPSVRDSTISGTGLGLSISLEIMQAFDGDLRVASRLAEGTTVTLAFPRNGEHPSA